ncbi:hypothetical protein Tco_1326631 [Tanacetum coccineum]
MVNPSSFSDEETHEEIEKVEEIEEAVAHCEPAPRKVTRSELPIVSNYVALCEPSILFPRCLEQHAEEALVYKTMESLKRIKEEIDYRCSMLDQGEPQEIETFVKPNRKRDMDFSSVKALTKELKDEPLGNQDRRSRQSTHKERITTVHTLPSTLLMNLTHREPAPREVTRSELPIVSNYVAPCKPSILFPRRLEQHAEEALVYKTMESLKRIKLPPKEQDLGSFNLPCSIGKLNFSNALADLGASVSIMPCSMFKRLKSKGALKWGKIPNNKKVIGDGCEFWASCIPYDDQCNRGDFPDNTKKKCYWGCLNDDKRLDVAWEGVSFKDWVRVSHGKKVEVTRYTINPGKSYTKDRILGIEEMHRTSANIAAVRAKLLEEMDTEGSPYNKELEVRDHLGM